MKNLATTPTSFPVLGWIHDETPIEDEALQQVHNLAKMPFLFHHVAVMPDVHAGKGSTIGTVFATREALIPSAVGVDIGCGMVAVRTSLSAEDLPDSLVDIRSDIEARVPVGIATHTDKYRICSMESRLPAHVKLIEAVVRPIFGTDFNKFMDKVTPQLGTLGGGNHFIELCLDEVGQVWIMLHSGSRGIGNMIGSYYIDKAKEQMARWLIDLPDKDLAYLPRGTDFFVGYWSALQWAQQYAANNRTVMLEAVFQVLKKHFPEVTLTDEAVNCHHNYASLENHFGQNVYVTRKGAVRAAVGVKGIIPGSMGAKSFIVEGKGNPHSFCSCSHGAGRKMSRTKAKSVFTVEDHLAATAGVECRKDVSVLDETPGAYKDIDQVMEAQADLVTVLHTLKQVLCVKG